MNYVHLMRAAICAATLGAGCVLAQTIAAPVVTDVAPAPAEDRDSTGAIVLQNSLVRAQRDNAFQRASSRNGLASVGQRAVRAAMDVQPQGELAQVREPRPIDLYQPGADRQIQN
ncbi:MAG: hypothetical protein JWP43_3679 [Ramlibacter sp.]|nr:hypothetical protein [Ramlibacter sp.]